MRKLIFRIILVLLVAAGLISWISKKQQYSVELQEGDLIFQESMSSQCEAVKIATKSKYSHMAMILYKDDEPWVFEAVSPVKYTRLKDWISHGKNGHYAVKRVKKSVLKLTDSLKIEMKHFAEKFEGKPYDIYFNWSDERIYCSELVYKVYLSLGVQIGETAQLKSFNLNHPKVQHIMAQRYGKNIPYEEICISPQSMFECDKLELVYSN